MSKLKIADLRAAETGQMHLKDAHGKPMTYMPDAVQEGEKAEPIPIIVTIYGPGSEQNRVAQLEAKRRLMELMQRAADAGRAPALTAEQTHADGAELLADIVAEFPGIDFEGKSPRDGLRDLFADPACGYITDQVNNFAGDWANFCKGAVKA